MSSRRVIAVDLAFEHAYRAEVRNDFPSSERSTARSFGPLSDPETDIVVRVDPLAGEEWTGLFGPAYTSPPAANGVFATPDPNWLCVVVGGRAMAIRADLPGEHVEIPVFPVTSVMAVVPQRLLLFAGFTSITAWGSEGVKWGTRSLSWDGIRLGNLRDGVLLDGEGWSAPENRFVPFEVDLRNGDHRGGASSSSRPRSVP